MLSRQAVLQLAGIGRIATRDINARPIMLLPEPENGRLKAIYKGSYVMGEVSIESEEAIFDPMAVGASQFLELAKLFEDGVTLTQKGDALELSDGACTVSLQTTSFEIPEEVLDDGETTTAIVSLAKFREEIALAEHFVSEETTAPILRGVRLMLDGKGTLSFLASDGGSVLFCSTMPYEAEGESAPVDATIVGKDALITLSLLAEVLPEGVETIKVVFIAGDVGINKVLLLTDTARMTLSTRFGKWPDQFILPLLAKTITDEPLTLPASTLDRILTGVKVLEAGKDVAFLRVDDTRFEIATAKSETGSLRLLVSGMLPVDTITLSATTLEGMSLVAKQPFLFFPTDSGPVLATDESRVRRFYATRRASR